MAKQELLQAGHRESKPDATASTTDLTMRQHAQRIQDQAREFTTALEDAADDLHRFLLRQCERRPYSSLATAAAVGYVLGGGLATRLTAVMLDTAKRLTFAVVARELSARLTPSTVPAYPEGNDTYSQ